jgi:hypothetical protein
MRDLSLRQIGAMDMAPAACSGLCLASPTTPLWPTARRPWKRRSVGSHVRGVIMHTGQGSEPAKALLAYQQLSVTQSGDGATIQAAFGTAEKEPIAELLATTRTAPVVLWAPSRAAGDLRDTP